MSTTPAPIIPSFRALALIEPVLTALDEVGYENPSPIQAEIIPYILEGRDVLGQAQTGTGKTAAFALPLLSRLDLRINQPQVLVLAPTRELAIQVAEAFQRYAAHIKDFHVLPIYGGQDYKPQINQLRRGAHVIVGTPGRVMDHMRRGTLKLEALKALVLDEADEMLRMGFIDDVEWILEQTPETRQIALFSATMPEEIRHIAKTYLHDPKEVKIKVKTTTADTIRQRYWEVSSQHKLEALTRILEAEPFDGMIIFVRTKIATEELAEKLLARGYAVAALNGDIVQKTRERTVEQLKTGQLDILIATDVVARGLDVERVSHVINYDIPYDTESYVHRIGRTGRAGRKGDAILFIAPRERRMLQTIERATRQKIELMELPSTEEINDKRIGRFKQKITDMLATEHEDLELFHRIIESYQHEHNIPAIEIACALAKLLQGETPLLLAKKTHTEKAVYPQKAERGGERSEKGNREDKGKTSPRKPSGVNMQTFRIEVGREHQAKPGHIVGAIANEIGIDSKFIGRIELHDNYSLIDLPADLPKDALNILQKTRVSGLPLRISRVNGGEPSPHSNKPPRRKEGEKGNRERRTFASEGKNKSKPRKG